MVSGLSKNFEKFKAYYEAERTKLDVRIELARKRQEQSLDFFKKKLEWSDAKFDRLKKLFESNADQLIQRDKEYQELFSQNLDEIKIMYLEKVKRNK